MLGGLTASATSSTERGRRPFRSGGDWQHRLGELAYGVYLLADQTGVDLAEAIEMTAGHLEARAENAKTTDKQGWPF
jgi:hypothetical protein